MYIYISCIYVYIYCEFFAVLLPNLKENKDYSLQALDVIFSAFTYKNYHLQRNIKGDTQKLCQVM